MKKLILFLTVIAMTNFVNAQTYYVSNTSGGTNQGTQTNPWISLASINWGSVRSLLLKKGDVFNEAMTIGASGSAGNPIVIGSYGTGAKPVISGFVTAGSWVSIGSGIYESVLSGGQSTCNMVTVNGVFQPIGRYPKVTATNSGYLTFQSHSGTSSVTSNVISGVPNFSGGQVVIRARHWLLNKGTINTQTSNTVTYTQLPGPYCCSEPSNGFGLFFQNHKNALTAVGDWAYVPATKKLQMYFGSNLPTSYTVKASVVDNLITLASRSYITFDNISFTGSNSRTFNISASSYITINNCDISYSGGDGIYTALNTSNHISLTNSTISYTNNNGIAANTTSYYTIQNNVISNTAMTAGMGISGDGQYIAVDGVGANSLVQYNEVVNSGYVGMNLHGGGTTVKNNFIHEFCLVKDDGGGIYMGAGTNGATVQNNIVLNGIGQANGTSDGYASATGIYMDDNVSNVQITGNTAANNAHTGFLIHNANAITITGNTSYNNGRLNNGGQINLTHDNYGGVIRNIVMNNNIFVSKNSLYPIMWASTITDDIDQFGTFDYNYYACPINENHVILKFGSSPVWMTLAQWQASGGQDAHSKKSPKSITTVNDLRFEYNTTSLPKTINLGSNYIDIKGVAYSTITLAPYASSVLILTGGTPPPPPPVTYSSAAISSSFTRNNCLIGSVGGSVVYGVPAGKYTSAISQSDANSKASADITANGQNFANQNGSCTDTTTQPPVTYFSMAKSQSFTRNNCPAGSTGSSVVYTVSAGKYSSTISQQDADVKAQSEISNNGQGNANVNGTCTAPPPPSTFKNSKISKSFTKNNCTTGTGTAVTYTVNAGKYSSTISQADADNKATADIAANGQTYANSAGSCVITTNCSFWDKLFKRKGCRF